MSELKEILKRIYEEEKVPELYERLGCKDVKREQRGRLVTASLPTGDNKRSVQTYCDNKKLVSFIRTRNIKGNVFDIIGHIKFNCQNKEETRDKLYDVKRWIYDEFDWHEMGNGKYEPKEDYLDWLKKIKQKRKSSEKLQENKVLPESVLLEYVQLPHQKWIDEGLSYKTLVLFNVGYCMSTDRITIPLKNKNGKIVGIKGRYVGDDEEVLDGKKYIYLHPCNGGWELFNLHRALPHIEEKKQVIVVEAEKSCMFLTQYGFPNCVAIGGSNLTEQQIRMLKNLGMDVEIVLAWDKDKDREFIKGQIKNFGNRDLREISIIFDKGDLLEEKMSPADNEEVWCKLYNEYKHKL